MSTQAKRPASDTGSESESESEEEETKNSRVNTKAQQQQQEPAKQQQAAEDEDGEEESETDSDEDAGARYDTVKRDVYPGTAAAAAKPSATDYPAGKRGRDLNGGKVVAEEPVNKKRKEFKGGEDKARAYAQPVRPSSPNKTVKPDQVAKAATRGAAATRAEKAKAGPAGRGETVQPQGANRKAKATQMNSSKQKGEVEKSSPVKGKKTAHWPNTLEQSLVSLMYNDRRSGFVLPVSRGDGYWEKLLNRLPLEGEMTELQVVDKVKRMRNRYHALQRQFKEEGKPQFKNAHEEKLYQFWEIIWGSGTETTGRGVVPHPATDEESSEDDSEGTPGEAARVVLGQRKAEESSSEEEEEAVNVRRKTAGINQINATTGKAVSTPFVAKPRLAYTPIHPMDAKRGGDIHSRDYHHEDGVRGDVTSPKYMKQLRAETHTFFQEIRRNCFQLVEDIRGDKLGSFAGGLGGLSFGSLGTPDAFALGPLAGTPAALQLQRRWGEFRIQELALQSERLQLLQEQCRLQQEELEMHNQKG